MGTLIYERDVANLKQQHVDTMPGSKGSKSMLTVGASTGAIFPRPWTYWVPVNT